MRTHGTEVRYNFADSINNRVRTLELNVVMSVIQADLSATR